MYDSNCIKGPVAQPRNVIGGYVVSSFTGVVVRMVCAGIGLNRQWAMGGFAVAFALIFMNLTKTVHPPAGAVALISIIGPPGVQDQGFGYVITSFGASVILVGVAVVGNNLFPTRQYPTYWW